MKMLKNQLLVCSKNTKYKPAGKKYTDEIKQLVLTLNFPLKLLIFRQYLHLPYPSSTKKWEISADASPGPFSTESEDLRIKIQEKLGISDWALLIAGMDIKKQKAFNTAHEKHVEFVIMSTLCQNIQNINCL